MKAFVTTIGEKTRPLCVWALERNGFEVIQFAANNSLAEKLHDIYEEALEYNEDFIRVDADVVVNRNCTEEIIREIEKQPGYKDAWWIQFRTYDWFQQNPGYGGVQYIKKEALPVLSENIRNFMDAERPETELSRSYGMYNPRRFESHIAVMGIHNYKNDMQRVAEVKQRRGQSSMYDFELAKRLEEL